MPKQRPQSFADKILDWEGLIRSYNLYAEELAGSEPLREGLADILSQAHEVKTRQKQHIGEKQRATQEIRFVTSSGEEAARRLRRAIAARFGTNNEILAQFRIAPIRPRSRKKQEEETPPAPDAPPEEEPSPPQPE